MAEDSPVAGALDRAPPSHRVSPAGPDIGWAVIGTLLSGMVVWGGVGWLLDRWLGHAVFFALVGVILGLAVAIYLVVVKYGAVARLPGGSAHQHDPGRATEPARSTQDAEGTTVTSSALALGSVLAAEAAVTASRPPTSRSSTRSRSSSSRSSGIDFEITRITLILWIATAAMLAFLVATVRKPADRARASCSSSARAATPWSATASPAT